MAARIIPCLTAAALAVAASHAALAQYPTQWPQRVYPNPPVYNGPPPSQGAPQVAPWVAPFQPMQPPPPPVTFVPFGAYGSTIR